MVRARGLEPPILSEPDPKSGASAIPPRARVGTKGGLERRQAQERSCRENPFKLIFFSSSLWPTTLRPALRLFSSTYLFPSAVPGWPFAVRELPAAGF